MGEIKRGLKHLPECESYVAKDSETYIIEDEHSLADIVRFCCQQVDADEVIYLAKEVKLEEEMRKLVSTHGDAKVYEVLKEVVD